MKDMKKKILELHKNGIKRKEISEKLNVKYSTVSKIVKNDQLKIRRAKNPEKFREKANARYPRYAKKAQARSNKYYSEKKDEILAGYKEDRKKNPKKWFEIRKKYRKRNPEHVKDLRNKNYAKHKEKNRPRLSKRGKEIRKKTKLEVYTHYSNGVPKCACCGVTGIEFLTVDHIIPKLEMKKDQKMIEIGFRTNFKAHRLSQWLIKNNFPKGFQIFCWNCNYAKGVFGECPHKIKLKKSQNNLPKLEEIIIKNAQA